MIQRPLHVPVCMRVLEKHKDEMITKSKKAKMEEQKLEAIRQKVRIEEERTCTEDTSIRDWTNI